VRVIGVIDILHGRAVLARAGDRARYEPVFRVAGREICPGDAEALANRYLRLGLRELYVADLDAIQGRALNADVIRRLAALGAPLWTDAAVCDAAGAERVAKAGSARVVVGLETLSGPEMLRELRDATGPGALAFSLDLRNGEPILAPRAVWPAALTTPIELVRAAADAGVDAVIVLDLARVGMASGLDERLLADVRRTVPDTVLLAGGGVSGPSDLWRLSEIGCDGALVATVLHDGRLSSADIKTISGWPCTASRHDSR
jgi:phosphoribosylformimino-5-aminoimidazole carboxamide ribotide isomerase